MQFSEQIKKLRNDNNLTQDEMAERLFVTRQAISNWENDKNLPDILMLLSIAREFNISLDELILGGNDMTNMTEKLIEDTNEGRRAKKNLTMVIIGTVLLLIGLGLFIIKALSVEYIDETGILHENFFLLPIGFLFLFSGFVTFMVAGIKKIKEYVNKIK